MKNSKKNLITEINRIHQLMGVKKLITESRKILVPLLQIAQEIVEFASKRNLDNATRRSVNQLSTGSKGIVDSQGNPIPLTADDYVRIFDDLRKSVDPAIVAKMDELDRKVVSAIQDNISELITPDIRTLIKRYIDEGATEDFVVTELQKIFRNTGYGRYADFTTVVDDAGKAVETLVDDYLKEIRKVYEELGGVLDGVVDDAGIQRSFDDLGNDIVPNTEPIPNNPNSAIDEAVNEADEVGRQQTEELMNQNITRDLADLDPGFFAQLRDSFYSLMERILVGYGSDGRTVRERVFYNLERLEQLSQVPATDETARQATELQKLIKADMDMLRNMNRDYIELVKKRIENGSSQSNPNVEERRRWAEIGRKLETVRTKYGDWGVLAVSSPNSTRFLATKAGLKSAYWLERFISRAMYKILNLDKMVEYWVNLARGKHVDKVEPPDVSLFESMLFPGSPRGIPRGLKSFEGKTLPNAYQEILESAKRFPKYKAWYSLVAEKLVLIAKLEGLYAIVGAYLKYKRFADTDKKFIMENYGECVFAISEEMKKGNMSLEGGIKEGATIPPCLQKLIDNKIDDEILGQILIRADFFSMGDGATTYFGFLNRERLDMSVKEFLTKMLTGQLAVLVYNIWDDELLDAFYESEKTGSDNPLQNALKRLDTKYTPLINDVDERLEREANNLNLNTTITAPDSVPGVDPFGRTSNDNNP